jgi:hypothetical protein
VALVSVASLGPWESRGVAHVELVAKEAFERVTGVDAAGCLAFMPLASVLRRQLSDRGGGGVVVSVGTWMVLDGAPEGQ